MTAHRRKSVATRGAPRRHHQPVERHPGLPALVLRNVTVSGRRTSLRLEPAFWSGLNEICVREEMILNQLCTAVDRRRGAMSLTQSVRVFVVSYFRSATPTTTATPPGDRGAFSQQLRSVLDAIA